MSSGRAPGQQTEIKIRLRLDPHSAPLSPPAPRPETLLFTTVGPRWPAWYSLSTSAAIHTLFFFAAAFISIVPAKEAPKVTPDPGRPTEIRIGDTLYYVNEVPLRAPAAPAPKPVEQAQSSTPRKGALTAPRPAPDPKPEIKQPETTVRAAALPRTFVPPEVKRNRFSEQTLIQPSSTALEPPPEVRLPTFRVWTADWKAPKIPKPFVAPGRKQAADGRLPELAAPERAFAEPAPTVANPKLQLPPPPAPIFDAPPKPNPDAAPRAPQGDPVSVLSLNSRPMPLQDRLLIPPGNQVGRTGDNSDNAALGDGTGTGRVPAPGTTRQADSRGAGDSNSKSAAPGVEGTATGQSAGLGSTPGSGQGSQAGKGTSLVAASGSGNGAGNTLTGAAGRPGVGSGAARPSAVPPNIPGLVRIERPANGVFDAVVVSSQSPFDLFPESRGLLTGRPIYTVYLAMGTTKDWTLYFCVPGERPDNASAAPVVAAGGATPVRAPYPTVMLRPPVVLSPGNKYMLVHGFIDRDGRFQNLRIVRKGPAEMNEALLASLATWEFRPATRDGQPMQVEFLLSVPADKL